MRKMSLLSPKMNELKAKYPDDPQKMNEEVMKLYREYGVNPFSGCFPMLIQIRSSSASTRCSAARSSCAIALSLGA